MIIGLAIGYAVALVIIVFLAWQVVVQNKKLNSFYAGDLVITETPERKIATLELATDPDEIEHHGIIYFRVVKSQEKQ